MSVSSLELILDDNFKLVTLSRKGVPFSLFSKLVDKSPFTFKEWSTFLHLTERTLQRYKKESKSFDPIQAEKILEIALLQKQGAGVFGNAVLFNKWMSSNLISLGGVMPKELLDSSFGIDLIKEELIRIEHGVLA